MFCKNKQFCWLSTQYNYCIHVFFINMYKGADCCYVNLKQCMNINIAHWWSHCITSHTCLPCVQSGRLSLGICPLDTLNQQHIGPQSHPNVPSIPQEQWDPWIQSLDPHKGLICLQSIILLCRDCYYSTWREGVRDGLPKFKSLKSSFRICYPAFHAK